MAGAGSPFRLLRALPLALGVALLTWSFLYSIPVLPLLTGGPPIAQTRAADAEQAFREQFEKAWTTGFGAREGEPVEESAAGAAFLGKWGAWGTLQPGPFLAGASLTWVALSAFLVWRRKQWPAGRLRAAGPYLALASALLAVVLIVCTIRSRSMAISLGLAVAAPDVFLASLLVMAGVLALIPEATPAEP